VQEAPRSVGRRSVLGTESMEPLHASVRKLHAPSATGTSACPDSPTAEPRVEEAWEASGASSAARVRRRSHSAPRSCGAMMDQLPAGLIGQRDPGSCCRALRVAPAAPNSWRCCARTSSSCPKASRCTSRAARPTTNAPARLPGRELLLRLLARPPLCHVAASSDTITSGHYLVQTAAAGRLRTHGVLEGGPNGGDRVTCPVRAVKEWLGLGGVARGLPVVQPVNRSSAATVTHGGFPDR
jgi:hypothetical protein